MITIRSKTLLLCACLVETVWLLVAQMLNVTALLLPCLACFLVLVAWSAIKNMAMPVMLYFLPFSPLLKIRPGTISFFTIALLLVYAIFAVTGSRQRKVLHLIPALLLVVMTLVVKTAYGYEMDNTYILFIITLMLVPFLAREMDEGYDFYWLAVCFALGVCIAAITAQFMTVFPTISRYITVDVNSLLGYSRLSGYMGDPNFYSCHITVALSGMLVLLLNNDNRKKLFVLVPLVCALLYCGLLSVSKSFLLISACLLLLWVLEVLFRKGKASIKVTLIFTLVIGGVFLLSSTIFTDLLGTMFSRFGQDSNLSDFTTGRTDVWNNYITAIFSDARLLFFGQGYTSAFIGDKATHNTLLQSLFQFGVIGLALVLAWIVFFVQSLLDGAKAHWRQGTQLAILLIGAFGPWLALDYVFFDEFFLLPFFVCMAVRFLHQKHEESEQVETEEPVEVEQEESLSD